MAKKRKGREMCAGCPYRRGTKFNLQENFNEMLRVIDKQVEKGILKQPHSCHSLAPNDWENASEERQCIGHRARMIKQGNLV